MSETALAILIKRSLEEQGYGVADSGFVRIEQTSGFESSFAILMPKPESAPAPRFSLLHRQPKVRSQVVCTLYFQDNRGAEESPKSWVMRVYGDSMMPTAENIARELDRIFAQTSMSTTVVVLFNERNFFENFPDEYGDFL